MRAYRLQAEGKLSRGALTRMETEDLTPGDTLIRVRYAGLNYKDALAGQARAPIATDLPINAGIEAVGEVVESADPAFAPGQVVIAHGMGLGVSRDGGLADYVRAEADWLVPLPDGLDPWQAAALGVAGFSAALAVDRLEGLGLAPGRGPVAVTGATGGVGGHAVAMLAGLGHEVVAVTSKPDMDGMLRGLGASDVIAPPDPSTRMLDKGRWAGAVDTVGGEVLGWLLRSAAPGATLASIGNAGGNRLETSVIPFILRGVTLTGINANAPPPLRLRIWGRMAADLRAADPGNFARTIAPREIDAAMTLLIEGRNTGRVVADFAASTP